MLPKGLKQPQICTHTKGNNPDPGLHGVNLAHSLEAEQAHQIWELCTSCSRSLFSHYFTITSLFPLSPFPSASRPLKLEMSHAPKRTNCPFTPQSWDSVVAPPDWNRRVKHLPRPPAEDALCPLLNALCWESVLCP